MPKQDRRILHLGNRERGPGDTVRGAVADIDDDAPDGAHFGEDSRQVIVDALRHSEPGSDAEKTILAAFDLLVARSQPGGSGSGGGDGLSRGFVAKVAAFALSAMVLVQPTIEQVAHRFLSPSSALERKLDETLVSLSTVVQTQAEMQATFTSLSRWIVDCELAHQAGAACPAPPVSVRLLLVQDEMAEVTRNTGP